MPNTSSMSCHHISALRPSDPAHCKRKLWKLETRSSLRSDSFPQCSSLGALFMAQEIKKCIFGAPIIFHARTVVAGPCTASNHLTVVITGSGKKGNISKRTGGRPSNTCMCDGIAGVCRWERSQHLNFTLELSFFILQHFLTTPITFHVQLGHDSWSWFTTWFFRGATDWKCLTFPAFARFNNSHTL